MWTVPLLLLFRGGQGELNSESLASWNGVPELIISTIFMILCIAPSGFSQSNDFNVVAFGAVGDGKTDDSQAFLKAWGALCGASSGAALIIPAGKTFLLKPVNFSGPCKSTTVHVQVLGNIVAPLKNSWITDMNTWIQFENVRGLIIDGSGQIDGQGREWWSPVCKFDELDVNSCPIPTALTFHNCNDLQLRGLNHVNSQRNHISINSCNGVTISNIHIATPQDSPNTDGIDISSSTNIQITDSSIQSGDDCIAINGGSSFINITGVSCGPGHGISVGSLGANGAHEIVEEVHVRGCNCTGTKNGVRIKTWQGGSGFARKISFEQITFIAVDNPIIIDQYYCNGAHNCPNKTMAVQVSDITYSGVHGTSIRDEAINLSCSESVGCTNIVMDQVNITPTGSINKTSSYCINAHGRSTATSPIVSCLSSAF